MEAWMMLKAVWELLMVVFWLVCGFRAVIDAFRLLSQVKKALKEVPHTGEGLKSTGEIGEKGRQGHKPAGETGQEFPMFEKLLADLVLYLIFFLQWKL